LVLRLKRRAVRAHERTPGTRAPRRDRARLNEAQLDVDSDAISDSAIDGLIEGLIVPMIVEKAIHSMIASGSIPPVLQNRGFDTYNYLGSDDCSDEEFERRASAEARPAKADPAASTHVDGRGV
jgi:hypothetical protein